MTILILGILGVVFGSFVTAFSWRLHEGKNFITGRSQCEACGHQLSAVDLVPVFSWLALGGKCRYCRKLISGLNPTLEIGLALLFIISYIFWPLELTTWQAWVSFSIWLVYIVMLVTLVVYDFKWMLLPNRVVFPLILLALIDAAIRLSLQAELSFLTYLQHVLFGGVALAGFYWLLHTASKGRWVGLGDVKLGLFMGIALGWQQALLILFTANIIGFLVVAPGLAAGKLTVKSRVPFGPFLIAAFFIAGLLGERLIEWYLGMVLGSIN